MQPISPAAPPSVGTLPLLSVSKLSVTYSAQSGSHPALHSISLDMAVGEVIGVLGESGCGKSTLALSLLGLLPADTRIEGKISFRGQNLLGLSEAGLRQVRGAKISLIHQEPGLALSPVMRVGDQISEVLRAHSNLRREERRRAVKQILAEVQLPETDRIYNAYPHQLSGGELHRVAIAQALVCRPDLVIADESTRSLDLGTQAEIIGLLMELNQKSGMAILFITHNPTLLAGFVHRVIVMNDGRLIEEGALAEVFRRPLHPYTHKLLSLVPETSNQISKKSLSSELMQ